MQLASNTLSKIGLVAAVLATATGCASLSSPFNNMKDQPMTVYRLQNYEPQPAQAATPAATAPGGLQLPPQLAQWATQAAQLLPPGLLPPGLLPGTQPAAVQQNAPRFDGFVILGTSAVNDNSLRSDILDAFGHESNFSDKYENCFFPEFGFAMAQPGGQTVDVLVSLSCQQVKTGNNYPWPYGPKIGIPPDTQKKIAAIVQKAFGG